jgi:hypothetical protein
VAFENGPGVKFDEYTPRTTIFVEYLLYSTRFVIVLVVPVFTKFGVDITPLIDFRIRYYIWVRQALSS